MAVIVRRISDMDGVHSMSVVADDRGVEYVLPSGVEDAILDSDRPARFEGRFEEDFGRKPSSPEDWAECAVYNLGWVSVSDPVDNSYKTKAAAAKAERREIDKAVKAGQKKAEEAKVFSDADMTIGPDDTLEAVIDPEDGSVVALTLAFARSGGNSDFLYYRVNGMWTNEPEIDITDEDMDYEVRQVPVSYVADYDDNKRNQSDLVSPMTAAAACPAPTQDIPLNLANRQKAIDGAGYGPMNPKRPNEAFWQAKADRWSTTIEEAKSSKCGNCAAFIITPTMRECINQGLGDDSDSWSVVEAGELGYCEAFDFKCASERTCDAWIVGGPVTEEK